MLETLTHGCNQLHFEKMNTVRDIALLARAARQERQQLGFHQPVFMGRKIMKYCKKHFLCLREVGKLPYKEQRVNVSARQTVLRCHGGRRKHKTHVGQWGNCDSVQETSTNGTLQGKQHTVYLHLLMKSLCCAVFFCCGKGHLIGKCCATCCLSWWTYSSYLQQL